MVHAILGAIPFVRIPCRFVMGIDVCLSFESADAPGMTHLTLGTTVGPRSEHRHAIVYSPPRLSPCYSPIGVREVREVREVRVCSTSRSAPLLLNTRPSWHSTRLPVSALVPYCRRDSTLHRSFYGMDTPTPSNDTLPHHQPRIFDMAESPTPVNATSTPSPPSSTSGKDFQNIVREPDPSMNHLLTTIFTNPTNRSLHAGVVFHDLTVTGLGLGASLQPTNSDLLLGPFRGIKALVTGKGFRPPATRTLLNGFTGCVRPGEMLLVLGRPGAGCSTFLKAIGNQRSGFQNVTGDVRYGGVDWRVMADRFRGEVLYNAEEDVHYATLTVRETLDFALKTRGSTRAARKEFLRSVAQLFWIEHTLDTKVGGEIVRGVSGGEKKRVSIAEAMATRASCQCWDNSTKGLDASTAMEYVGSLRALTDMAGMATCVALYQAGEQLGELFDKVILIEGGRCAYFGRMG